MKTQALDNLVRALHDEFEGRTRAVHIVELLGEYARFQKDWQELALFSDQHYTRNLVVREPRFELMVLCWKPGQESAIHNHEGQDCWMAVLSGEVEEVRFPWPAPEQTGPLRAKGTQHFASGRVAFIRDEIGLHLVRPAAASPTGCVTLHLYSLPFDACNCYCPDTCRVERKQLSHHSIRGRLVGAGG